MNDDTQIESSAELINGLFANIERSEIDASNKIVNNWKKTLLSIHNPVNENTGENLASHSHIVDLKNGSLLVEADHPGWIQMLQMYKKFILTGLKKLCPELEINSIVFRLKGSTAELHGQQNFEKAVLQEKKKMEQSLEKEEQELSRRGFTTKKDNALPEKKELPADLKEIFTRFSDTMLTNSGK